MKRSGTDEPPLELIHWIDSASGNGRWINTIDLKERVECCIAKSVGYVVGETDTAVMVVPHLVAETNVVSGCGCGDMTIPKVAILERYVLVVQKRRRKRA